MMIEAIYDAFLNSAGVSTDTRTIVPGSLFVALKGERFDANELVPQALELGASAVITSDARFASEPRAFVVEDTLVALQQLAKLHRSKLKCPIVGITGTNGKTTTKELVTAVLSKKYKTVATKGNLNNHIGVPLTILGIGADCEMAVVEMGANHPGEIAALTEISKPNVGLITNVGMAHILGFGSFEGVVKTKSELYDSLRSSKGTIFVDPNNPYLTKLTEGYRNIVSYVSGYVKERKELLELCWKCDDSEYSVQTNLSGAYNLQNALAAITVGMHFKVPAADINAAIEEYIPKNNRSQIYQTERNRLVVDAYNANPSSMNAALDNLFDSDASNKVVVLGGMKELGHEEERQHKLVLDRLAAMRLDKVILIGPEFMRFKQLYSMFEFFATNQDSIPALKQLEHKYILVKGSNSNRLTDLIEFL